MTGVPLCWATKAANVVGSIVGSASTVAGQEGRATPRSGRPVHPASASDHEERRDEPARPWCHAGMVEPVTVKDRPMALSPDDPVVAIDPELATRRTGRSKGPEAHIVLADALGIETVGQLLHHYPRRYIDRSRVLPIGQLKIDAFATVIATVRSVTKRQTRRRQTMVTVTIGDGTGFLDLTFFNQPWTASLYREGVELAVSGIVQLYRRRLQLANQEVEVLRSDEQDLVHTGRITPVHRGHRGHHAAHDP